MSEGITDRIDVLYSKINENKKIKLQGSLLRAKLPNFEENEPTISFLNALEKRKGEQNLIFNIYEEESKKMYNGTGEVKDAIFNFYSKLYKKEKEDIREQTNFLDKIDKSITPEQKEKLETDLTETELYDSLKSLPDFKSPGPDGLTKGFYLHFWHKLKPLYMNCVRAIKEEIELSEIQKREAIKILFKKGDRTLIKNYRPVTLLSVDVKIITKALANWVQCCLL